MAKLDNPQEIEKVFTSRNNAHLSQSEGTPFTIFPLKYILRPDSFTPFGNALLTGTVDMTNLSLSKLQTLYFTNLQKASISLASPLSPHISVEGKLSGFRKWKKAPLHPHLKDTSVNTSPFWFQTVMMKTLKILPSTTPFYKLSTL